MELHSEIHLRNASVGEENLFMLLEIEKSWQVPASIQNASKFFGMMSCQSDLSLLALRVSL